MCLSLLSYSVRLCWGHFSTTKGKILLIIPSCLPLHFKYYYLILYYSLMLAIKFLKVKIIFVGTGGSRALSLVHLHILAAFPHLMGTAAEMTFPISHFLA